MSAFPSPSVLHTVTLPQMSFPQNFNEAGLEAQDLRLQLPPIPPDIQVEGQLKLIIEPGGSLFGPPSAFNMAMKAAPRPPFQRPEMITIDAARPWLQLWTPHRLRDLAQDQDWLTLMSTQRTNIQSIAPRSLGRTAIPLPTEPHATGSVRSRSVSSDGTNSPTCTRRRRGKRPYPPRVHVEKSKSPLHHQSEDDDPHLGSQIVAADHLTPNSATGTTSHQSDPDYRLPLSDFIPTIAEVETACDKVQLNFGTEQTVSVSKVYLSECRERAFELFPRKLAGIGTAIDKRYTHPASHLWAKPGVPISAPQKAKTALLLLIIHYGHINPRPSAVNPTGLSVKPEEFADFLIDSAQRLLNKANWECIIRKDATLVIQPTLLLGLHCHATKEGWPAFEPLFNEALRASQYLRAIEKDIPLAIGQGQTRFCSNDREQEIRRRTLFGLSILASLRNGSTFGLTNDELDLPLPIDIRYKDIEDGQDILTTVEDKSLLSDVNLLIINARLIVAKSRLLNILGPIGRKNEPFHTNGIIENVLPYIEAFRNDVQTATKSNYYSFPYIDKALVKMDEVIQSQDT
ncbi:hypothetical protein SISSUDRAFT_1047228 [Sistotremastrum suecicum HHB10207 ss-3]|uniref:Transcription factor domain-containing protein n=1 Tax=Sistotremastrum suecicum HHB10207 ss-3 TaxID=1314776 RepID=A0A166D9J9_9AGAM|nr:hypothetical protein SISSUDRAFT_1047228 [Sistotremastrum suecicum HHB10207 ss-3]